LFVSLVRSALGCIAVALLLWCGRAAAVTPWTLLINTNNVITVTDSPYNALGDGSTDNTLAISNAIVQAAKGGTTNGAAGGTVRIPAGTNAYLCGPITLLSSVNLQVDAGAILRMLPLDRYPGGTANPPNFISGSGLHDIEISGPGAIDGQGAPWWPYADTNGANRPRMIALSGCNRELIQNITLSNSPMFHIAIGGAAGNTTVQGVIIRAPSSGANPPSHNTDACDVSGTNILVQNCDISVGDDNFTCGGNTSDILIMNNTYGYGHGVSIGSYTSPYVSNMTVVNCTFNNTDQGIRIKSDRDRGGFVHNIGYYNLSMTNVMRPILIYCQYTNSTSAYRALDSISPGVAASYPSAPVTGKTPTYRDITISNVTATAQSGRTAGLVWGLPEMSISNLTLIKVNLTGSKTFGVYDAKNVKLIDCSHSVPNGISQFSFCDTQVVFSNSTPPANVVTLDGMTTNAVANNFSFFNSLASLRNTNALGLGTPVTVGAATFTVSNNFALSASSSLTFTLGTNPAVIAIVGNLVLGATNNIVAAAGFTNGTYTLMTYTGTLSGTLPKPGSVPAGYDCWFDTNTAGQVRLVVTLAAPQPPSAPTGLAATPANALVTLTWSPAATATNYNVKRSTISGGSYVTVASTAATSFSDTQVTNGTTYYYVVSGVNANGEGPNSTEASATPQAPPPVMGANVYGDDFSSSTLNSALPSAPTPASTSYELMSSKAWNPSPSIAVGHLQFGIAATTSGSIQVQALFTNAPVTLANPGDNLSLTVTFTNTVGLLTQSGAMGLGLYCSGQKFPVPGGLNSTATTSFTGNAAGNAQTWVGYVAQLAFTGGNSQIMTRPAQTGSANNNQDCVTSGSGGSSYSNPPGSTVGAASAAASLSLVVGAPYTEVLAVTLIATNLLAITNSLYSGADTNGALLSQFGGVASGAKYLTNSFDALAIGWRATANTWATAIDINRIAVAARLTVPNTQVSLVPTNLIFQVVSNQLQLSWPADHLGWRLQMQTNGLSAGLGTNWVTVSNSTSVVATNIAINPTDGSVFLRLTYP